MKAYEATYFNEKGESTMLLIGADSFTQAARKAETEELLSKHGELQHVDLTEKVIL